MYIYVVFKSNSDSSLRINGFITPTLIVDNRYDHENENNDFRTVTIPFLFVDSHNGIILVGTVIIFINYNTSFAVIKTIYV
jgi:hypothetical protein